MASDTKNRILSVAARLFEAHGFEGTAVAAILREADVNSGSLYHFFPSKEALLAAVLDKYASVLEPALLAAADRATDDDLEKVFALVELYRGRLLVSSFERGCPVGDLCLEIGGKLPEARERIEAYFGEWRERVAGWLEVAGPRLPAGTDRRALAAHVLSVLQGAIMQARAATSIGPFDESVAQLRLLFALLEAEGTESDRGAEAWKRRAGAADTRRSPRPVEKIGAGGSERRTGDPVGGDPIDTDETAWWRAW